MDKNLTRSTDDQMVAGVAAGLADYMNMDPVLVRLLFVLLTLAGGPGLIIYIVMWLIMPENDTVADMDMDVDDIKMAS